MRVDEPAVPLPPDAACFAMVHAAAGSSALELEVKSGDGTLRSTLASFGRASERLCVDPEQELRVVLRDSASGAERLVTERRFAAGAMDWLLVTEALSAPAAHRWLSTASAEPDADLGVVTVTRDAGASLSTLALALGEGAATPVGTELTWFKPVSEAELKLRITSRRHARFTWADALPTGRTLLVLMGDWAVPANLSTTERSGVLALRLDADAPEQPSREATEVDASRILQDPILYALHGVPDLPTLAVSCGGTTLPDLAFGELAGPFLLEPDETDLVIQDGDTLLSASGVTGVRRGHRYLIAASGFAHRPLSSIEVLRIDESLALLDTPGEQRLRWFHAAKPVTGAELDTFDRLWLSVDAAGELTRLPPTAFGTASVPETGVRVGPDANATLAVSVDLVGPPSFSSTVDLSGTESRLLVLLGAITPQGAEAPLRFRRISVSSAGLLVADRIPEFP